jgi:hypothetical protein
MIRIIETTLTDGSEVYDVSLGDKDGTEISCVDENAAWGLANTLERCTPGGQFDGWVTIYRSA